MAGSKWSIVKRTGRSVVIRDEGGRCCYCRALRATPDPACANYHRDFERFSVAGFFIGLIFGVAIGWLLAKLFQA